MNIRDYAERLYFDGGVFFSLNKSKISYPEEGNQDYFQIEQESFWFSHRNNCILEAVQKYSPHDLFFDIGGGNGFVAKGLQDCHIETVLVEPGIDGVLNAKKRGVNHVICSTFEDAGFKPDRLMAVGLFDVIEHIGEDHQFLKSVHSCLAGHGIVYITLPAFRFLWSNEDVDAGHFRRYTLKKAEKLLAETGFKVIFSTYLFSVLPVPIFFFRVIPGFFGFGRSANRFGKHKQGHLKKNGLVNRLLGSIWKQEVLSIRKRKRILFGSSCFVIARKTRS